MIVTIDRKDWNQTKFDCNEIHINFKPSEKNRYTQPGNDGFLTVGGLMKIEQDNIGRIVGIRIISEDGRNDKQFELPSIIPL